MPRVPGFESLCLYHVGAYELLVTLNKSQNALTFGELYKTGEYKSPSLLLSRLKELETVGLIRRRIATSPGKPVSVRYEITTHGREVLELFKRIEGKVVEGKNKVRNLSSMSDDTTTILARPDAQIR